VGTVLQSPKKKTKDRTKEQGTNGWDRPSNQQRRLHLPHETRPKGRAEKKNKNKEKRWPQIEQMPKVPGENPGWQRGGQVGGRSNTCKGQSDKKDGLSWVRRPDRPPRGASCCWRKGENSAFMECLPKRSHNWGEERGGSEKTKYPTLGRALNHTKKVRG